LGGDCLATPWEQPFTYFPATITVDGETVADVGLRKKGFLGSLNEVKPSLKIKFDEYVAGVKVAGMSRMTLNNAKQDPSYINQCVGYSVFAAAGVPAPRCNFARVAVNGVDLGLYVHVESMKKPFIRNHFELDHGNLYEGTLSDFRAAWRGTFQKKTNDSDPDQSDIDAMVAAVENASDQLLLAQLAPLVDIDAFLTFWATEVLLGHWDGYAGNRNNFYIYRDPTRGQFQFFPWGIDAILGAGNPFGGTAPASVLAHGHLARRLYLLAETRDRYIDRLLDVLATAWQEAHLTSEMDRMAQLILPVVAASGDIIRFQNALTVARAYIQGRRQEIENELAQGPPSWTAPVGDPPCLEEIGSLSASFATQWGTIGGDPFNPGTSDMTLFTTDQGLLSFVASGAIAGPGNQQEATIGLVGALADGTLVIPAFSFAREKLTSGSLLAVDWADALGILLLWPPGASEPSIAALLAGGTVELVEASAVLGAPVTGTIDSVQIIALPFAQARGADTVADPRIDEVVRLVRAGANVLTPGPIAR
jgi:hypothetical protein